ncbi:YceI family protein [Shewanella sp. Isolate11]|uniref:YceI family protein n=1 Tax=Shewanella sp. Isolate11 TaxID=2908530 RepID=UPI001EFDD60B|nr:YceI family protein [Shewanella sp. Isolate11]MCG9696010.1 YceI family protein [Shewanella sp. Isolate11]
MKKVFLSSLLAFGLMMAASVSAADYVIDKQGAHASIQFKVSHLGYSFVAGRFNDFSGNFSFDKDQLGAAKIEVTINTVSVDSNHEARDEHLRSGDFLNVEKFPQASFKSTSVEDKGEGKLLLNGLFTLNGVTKPISIDAQYIGEGKDPWGGYRAGFVGSSEFALKDFGIDYDLGPSATKVALDFIVEGVKQ